MLVSHNKRRFLFLVSPATQAPHSEFLRRGTTVIDIASGTVFVESASLRIIHKKNRNQGVPALCATTRGRAPQWENLCQKKLIF